jgi:3-phosphoshikimate 1-carboxyvinyltransferase
MFITPFLDIPPLVRAGGAVKLPGSKSISNRVLLLSALAELCGEPPTTLHGLLDSDDTQVMVTALAAIKNPESSKVPTLKLFLGNAGTAMRPLTAALALLGRPNGGCYELAGVARMHERPIGDLVDALHSLGCKIDYLGVEGFPPLRISSPDLKLDQPIPVRGDVSSQFLTALLLALPLVAKQAITIEVVGELISKPYIDITMKLMSRFGVVVQQQAWQRFTIPAGSRYKSPGELAVEADASSASYFIALGGLAASKDKPLRIEGVGAASIQGDIKFIDAAVRMGVDIQSEDNALLVWRDDSDASIGAENQDRAARTGFFSAIDLDCNHIPDAAMTLAVMALYANGTSTLRNIASWRVKETDRIAAMACELRKFGATVVEGADYLSITPPATLADWRKATIHTYDDHRMAMCASLAAFNPAGHPVRIEDPKCVAKTYPDYFEALFSVSQTDSNSIPVISIDGPTASGKGTLAAAVAKRLGYHYLDSGALYRATALAAQLAKINLNDELALAALASRLPIRFENDRIFLLLSHREQDVTDSIRTEALGMQASQVSAYPAVRQALVQLQHGFRQLPGLVADGRDMGTVIFPSAKLKVFLTAGVQVRAERRYNQLISKGISANIDALCADLEARDLRDQSRNSAPLQCAKDAFLLDNSKLTIEASVTQVLEWWDNHS